MSPRRTTERDVPETDDRDGRHRRMSLRRKAETDGPSDFMSFHLGDIRLRHSSWPSQSRRRVPETDGAETDAPKTDVPETDAPKTDVPETDAPETDVPETDGAETEAPDMDVIETEEGLEGGRPRQMSPRPKVCF